jgi:hypothetical protein
MIGDGIDSAKRELAGRAVSGQPLAVSHWSVFDKLARWAYDGITMRPVVLAGSAIAVALAGVIAVLLASGAIGQGNTPPGESDKPPEKSTIEALMTIERATAEAGPRAPKVPLHITPIVSCPDPYALNPTLGISQERGIQAPPGWHGPVTNSAAAIASNGVAYTMFAGAVHGLTNGGALEGTIEVIPLEPDPCASQAGLAPSYQERRYTVPFQTSTVTLTEIDGDVAVFRAADGATGSLNYVTGTFQ